jgi:hypothetical protein
MFIIASISYAISIFIDVFTYHLKFHIHDNKNLRYIFSLINIFQFSARAFVLIYTPIMAYYTETVKDKSLVWQTTIMCHFFVILFILPLFSKNFSLIISKKIIVLLNLVFGKSKNLSFENLNNSEEIENEKEKKEYNYFFFIITFMSGFLFSFSTTFLFYLSFYYPTKALTLTSYSQIINMIGVLILVLLIDPKIMASIDKGKGHEELKLLTTSRIFVHFSLIVILLFIK